MTRSTFEGYLWLIFVDLMMRLGSICILHRFVRNYQTRIQPSGSSHSSAILCRAMDFACAFYPTRVLCLQRSAATSLMLRRHGWHAQVVIGATTIPFKSHAWVEVNGVVVSDKPYMRDMYQVLDLL
jgi:hypothetical protein